MGSGLSQNNSENCLLQGKYNKGILSKLISVVHITEICHNDNVRDDTVVFDDVNLFLISIKKSTRDYMIIASALDKNRSVFTQIARPLKDPTKVRKTTQEALMFPHFQVSIAAKKLGFQIRRVKRAGRMFSAANQTPTASVENGSQDQIPLHSMIGFNDGFT